MKQMIKTILLLLGMIPCLLQTASASDIRITLNQEPVSFDTAQTPFIENDRVLVPVRGILESLGYTVHWEELTQTVYAVKEELVITLPLGSDTAAVNGESVSIDAPAKLHNERTFVPLRFLAEYSGAEVLWDEATYTVSIYSQSATEEKDLKDSVVMLQTNKMLGSGVILSSDGLIVTNFHVIENASVVQVIFNDNTIYFDEVTVVGLNPEADLALLKINKDGLIPTEISTKELTIGEEVTAIGSPHGDMNKVTSGVVTSFDMDAIATTAEIAQGSSGGGLFNAEGKLIGISAAIGNDQFLSIPIALAEAIPQDLSIPVSEMKNYVYTPHAPQNLRYRMEDGYANVSWSPIYGADYFNVEIAYYPNGPFKPLKNTKAGRDHWYWGHPQCFGISINRDRSFYLKVTAIVDGVPTEESEVLKINFR